MSEASRLVTPVVRLAPAKLNLTLAVTGRREDGFHALHSVMVPLELADRLAITPAFAPGDRLHVTGPGVPDLGPSERNLVMRAIGVARAACRARGVDLPLAALAARLDKGDALPLEDRGTIAADLGSDVPFFQAGGWALVEGRGERVASLPPPRGPAPAVLLVTPGFGVSTAAVYAAYAGGIRMPSGAALASSRHLAGELAGGMTVATFSDRGGIMAVANDLAAATAALVLGLVPFRRALARLVARPVAQSGSGPTLWVLYPSIEAAETAAGLVREALAAGALAPPGDRPAFVAATPIAVGVSSRAAEPARPAENTDQGGT